ncbi:jg4384, partial [Pararge aegeria aegeria]
ITDSPLCRAYMEADETRSIPWPPASLPEGLGDLGGLLSFWSELGWLE